MPKIVGSRDLSHAHFQEKLFVCPLGIPHTKLRAKFEVSSQSSFRDIVLQAYWGHEFDLSSSRDVIGHIIPYDSPYTISYWWSFGT